MQCYSSFTVFLSSHSTAALCIQIIRDVQPNTLSGGNILRIYLFRICPLASPITHLCHNVPSLFESETQSKLSKEKYIGESKRRLIKKLLYILMTIGISQCVFVCVCMRAGGSLQGATTSVHGTDENSFPAPFITEM